VECDPASVVKNGANHIKGGRVAALNLKMKTELAKIQSLRTEYRLALRHHLANHYADLLINQPRWWQHLHAVSFFLCSSRSGSSLTAHLLRQQAQTAHQKLLCIPGEQRPHLAVAGFLDMDTTFRGDELTAADWLFANTDLQSTIRDELVCEIGWPKQIEDDLELFALRIYGRLLLQFPQHEWKLTRDTALIHQALLRLINAAGVNHYYVDLAVQLLTELKAIFNLTTAYFDHAGVSKTECRGPHTPVLLEEAPLIVPEPWQYPTLAEAKEATLFFKDPSDAWRMGFWKQVFTKANIKYTLLTRNPLSTINGIVDGWNTACGYFTYRLPRKFNIVGYTNPDLTYTNEWACFSLNNEIINQILTDQQHIVQVAALQWSEAYQYALMHLLGGSEFIQVDFAELVAAPTTSLQRLCKFLEVDYSNSLHQAANSLATTPIQVTPGTKVGNKRWLSSPYRAEIEALTSSKLITNITNQVNKLT
jgi:hypothetical protein